MKPAREQNIYLTRCHHCKHADLTVYSTRHSPWDKRGVARCTLYFSPPLKVEIHNKNHNQQDQHLVDVLRHCLITNTVCNYRLQKAVLLNWIGLHCTSVKKRENGKHLALKQLLPSWWQSGTLLQGVQASFNVWRFVFPSLANERLIVDNHNKPARGPSYSISLFWCCATCEIAICSTDATYSAGNLNLKTVLKVKCSLLNKRLLFSYEGNCDRLSCEMFSTNLSNQLTIKISVQLSFISRPCLCLVRIFFLWESC